MKPPVAPRTLQAHNYDGDMLTDQVAQVSSPLVLQ